MPAYLHLHVPVALTRRQAVLWVVPALAALVLALGLAVAALRQRRGDLGPLGELARSDAWHTETALIVLVGAAFLTFWWPRRRQARSFTLVATCVLGVLTLLLGLSSYLPCQGDGAPVLLPLTWTFGLFFASYTDVWGAGACAGTRPLAASVAQLTGLMATFVGFGAVLAAATRDQWDRLRTRLARSVVVVAGLDELTLPVVAALRHKAPNDTIVVVDPDAAHPSAGRVRALGARLVVGDLADAAVAASVVVRRSRLKARAVYLMSANRSVNFDRMTTLVSGLQGNGTLSGRPDGVASRLVVRIDDPWEVEDHRRTALDTRYEPWVLEAVSIYESTARAVVERLTAARAQRLLVVGGGPLTMALLAETARRDRELQSAVQLGVPPEAVGGELPPRVVVLCPDAEEILRDHADQQARFGNEPTPSPEAVVGDLAAQDVAAVLGTGEAWHVVVAAEPSTQSALVAARVSTRHPHCAVDVLNPAAARGPDTLSPHSPHSFPLTLFQPDGRLSDETWERVARLLHEHHRLGFPVALGEEVPPSRKPWDELPAFYRESGLRQIRSVLAAVSEQGRTWGPVAQGEVDVGFTEAELDRISAAEHCSWKAYYEQSGWRLLPPGAAQDPARRDMRHPMLRDWDDLTPAERRRTHRGVERTVDLLRILGYRPVLRKKEADVG